MLFSSAEKDISGGQAVVQMISSTFNSGEVWGN